MNELSYGKDALLKISEVASMLDVNPTTVLRWIERGYLKAIKYPSGSYRIERLEAERLSSRPRNAKEKYRVMVIDDEPFFLEAMQAMLDSVDLPLDVTTYTDGLDALLEVNKVAPHAIIIDYLLTTLDGETISEKIRAKPEYAAIPLILISGKVIAPPQRGRGADVFLRKPFSVDQIEEVLKEVLSGNSASKATVEK
jgi:CheY-like chemotaxis protein